MRNKTFLLATALFLLAQATSFAQGGPAGRVQLGKQAWTTLGGSEQRNGTDPATWQGPLPVSWSYSTGDTTNNPSSPASDGKYLYLCHSSEIVAIDQVTGEKHQSYDNGTAWFSSSPTVAGDVVMVGADDNYLYAFERPSLQLKWKFRAGRAVQSSPCVVGDMAFFGSDDGRLYAIRAVDEEWSKTPRLAWEYDTDGRIKSSPAYSGGTVFFSSFDGYFYAVRAKDGSLLWRFSAHKGIPTLMPGALPQGLSGYQSPTGYQPPTGYGSPGTYGYGYGPPAGSSGTVSNAAAGLLLPGGDEGSRRRNRRGTRRSRTESTTPGVGPAAVPQAYLRTRPEAIETEQLGWQSLEVIRPNYQMYASPVVANGMVYFASAGNLCAIESESGILRWLFKAQGNILGNPAVSRKSICFATDEGHVYCLNSSTKQLVWERTMDEGETFASPLSIRGNVVLARSKWGTLYGLKLDSGDLVWQYKLPESPAAAEQAEAAAEQSSATGVGPQLPQSGLGEAPSRILQTSPNYLGQPGQILSPGATGYPGYSSYYPQSAYPTTSGYTTPTATQPSAQQIYAITQVRGLEEKVTSAPVPVPGLLLAWSNDGTLNAFAPWAADGSKPDVPGAHIQFPGGDADYAYSLDVLDPTAKVKPSVSLPGSPPIYLSFWAFDEGSGIDPSTIKIARNGEVVDHKYVPDEGSIWFVHRFTGPAAGAMEDGDYEFVLTVGDWFGNVTQKKVVFTIDNGIAAPGQLRGAERVTTETTPEGTESGGLPTPSPQGASGGAGGYSY